MANRLAVTIMHELRAMLPPAIFFLISFNLLVLTIALLDDQSTVSAFSHLAACLGALLVAKAVLLSDMLPIVNRFRDGPLLHAILWKALLYFVATFLLHLVERLISAATNQYGMLSGVEAEVSQVDWGHFWAVQMWLALLFPVYVTSREVVRELGRDRIFELFFGNSARQ